MRHITLIALMSVLCGCLPAPHAELNRASDLYKSGRYDEAAREYQRVIEMRPSWAPPYVGLGNARWALNERAGAIEAYKRAVDLSPGWVDALTSLGKALLDTGRPVDAEPVLARAVQLAPDNESAKALLKQAKTHATAQGK